MIVVLFGPPGSGKGTQAQYLVKSGKYIHISTGELLREEINRATVLGKQVKDIMERGDFPSDEIIMKLIEKHLLESKSEQIILDGFPRTLNQVLEFEKIIDKNQLKIGLVIDFKIDFEMLVDRVSGRYSCKNCGTVYHDVYNKPQKTGICDICHGDSFERRVDDQPEVLKNRIQKYLCSTEAIKNYYADKGVVVSIDASNNREEVRESVNKTLAQFGFDI